MIGISHAAKLAPLLRAPLTRKMVEESASVIASEQALRRSSKTALLSPAEVVTRLLAKPKTNARPARQANVTDGRGRVLVSGERAASGAMTIKLTAPAQRNRDAAMEAIRQLLEKLG